MTDTNDTAFDASPDVEARLTEQTSFRVAPDARFGAQIEIPTAFRPDDRSGLSASTRNDVWIDRTDFTDRVTLETAGRLRRADGSPLPVTPGPFLLVEPARRAPASRAVSKPSVREHHSQYQETR